MRYSFAAVLALALVSGVPSPAAQLSYVGTFTQDDDLAYIPFVVSADGSVSIQTWSFAGGVNAQGTAIPAGGFAPVLTLIFPDDTVYIDYGLYGCGSCTFDPQFGYADAYISLFLNAGVYRVAITQMDNVPKGPFWSDGLTRAFDPAAPYLTGASFTNDFQVAGGPSAPFLYYLQGDLKRTGTWAVDVTGDFVGAAVPEPASLALAALGLALLLSARRALTRA